MTLRGPLAILGCLMLASAVYIPGAPEAKEDPLLAEIRSYASWTELTTEPVLMTPAASYLCTLQPYKQEPANPHRFRHLRVFANERLVQAIQQKSWPAPVGSIIVKRKLIPKSRGVTAVELLTVMVKREPGYNTQSGDWEYMVFAADERTVQERGKLQRCMSCHTDYSKRDFLALTYLDEYAKDREGMLLTLPNRR